MKYRIAKGHLLRWMLGVVFLCFWGVMWGWAGNSPTFTVSPNQTFCLDGSAVVIDINLPNGDIMGTFTSLTINTITIPTVQVGNNPTRRSFDLQAPVPCGQSLNLVITFDYSEQVSNNSYVQHTGFTLSTNTVNVRCPPNITYPSSPFCNIPGASYLPSPSSFQNPMNFSLSGPWIPINPTSGVVYATGQVVSTQINWVETTSSPNCNYQGSVPVSFVAPTSTATMSYPNTDYCINSPTSIFPNSPIPPGSTFSIAPNIGITNTGTISTNSSTPDGPYVITFTPPNSQCENPRNILINLHRDNVAFSYPANNLCPSTGSIYPNFTALPPGASGGSFTITGTSGTSPLQSDGEVNTANLISGVSYIVHYQTGDATCHATYNSSNSIVVQSPTTATFTYPNSEICRDGTPVQPTITGTGSGVFASNPGIAIAANGQITPQSCTMSSGPFTVTNTVSSPCPSTYSMVLQLSDRDVSTFYYGTNPNVDSAAFCMTDFPLIPSSPIGFASNGVYSFVSGPAVTIDPNTGILSNPTGSGICQIRYTSPNTCSSSFVFKVNILPTPTINFNYAPNHVCKFPGVTAPVLNAPPYSGHYACQGLIVHPQSGQVTPTGSTGLGGPFTVTFTTDPPECPATGTAQIWLEEPDTADFYYGSNPNASIATFCSNQGFCDAHFFQRTNPGGTFQIIQQSILNAATINGTTGQVTFNAARDTIVVQYTTPNIFPCGSDVDTFTIIVLNAPEADFDFALSSYCPAAGLLQPNPGYFFGQTAGTSIFSELNNNPGLHFSNTQTGFIRADSSLAGTYQVKHYVAINGTCEDSVVKSITINSVDDTTRIRSILGTYCKSDTIKVNVLHNIHPHGNWNLSATGITTVINDSTLFSGYYSGVGNQHYTITYSGYGLCGETQSDTFNVLERKPVVFFYPDSGLTRQEFCNNDVRLFLPNTDTLLGKFSYSDSTNLLQLDSLTGALSLLHAPQALYDIIFSPNAFCKLDGHYLIQVREAPDRDLLRLNISPDAICEGQPVLIELSPIDTMHYFINGTPIDRCLSSETCLFDSLNNNDSVRVQFINQYGCMETFRDTVTVHPYPILNLTPSDSTVYVESDSVFVTMSSSAPNTYYDWHTEMIGSHLETDSIGVDSTALPSEIIELYFKPLVNSGTSIMELAFYVTANAYGCYAPDDSVRFIIIPNSNPPIFIPGAFTPDGNGQNDTWLIKWPENDPMRYEDYTIEVYNRSGGVVLTQRKLFSTWTGDGLPDGVYRYILRDASKKVLRQGGVTIKR